MSTRNFPDYFQCILVLNLDNNNNDINSLNNKTTKRATTASTSITATTTTGSSSFFSYETYFLSILPPCPSPPHPPNSFGEGMAVFGVFSTTNGYLPGLLSPSFRGVETQGVLHRRAPIHAFFFLFRFSSIEQRRIRQFHHRF